MTFGCRTNMPSRIHRCCSTTLIFASITLSGLLRLSGLAYGQEPKSESEAAHSPVSPPSADVLADSMRTEDAKLADDLTATFRIVVLESSTMASGQDLGVHTKFCRYTASGGVRILVTETSYRDVPVYRAPGARWGSFDDESNQLLARSLRKVALHSRESDQLLDTQELLRITPSGSVSRYAVKTFLLLHDPQTWNSLYEFDQFQITLGRGFSNRLEGNLSLGVGDEELIELRGRGGFEQDINGVWTLHVAARTQAGRFIVHRAEFRPSGGDEMSLRIENSGRFEQDGVSVARRGVLSFPPVHHVLDVAVLELSTKPDMELLAEVQDNFDAKRLKDVEVFDSRASTPGQVAQPEAKIRGGG